MATRTFERLGFGRWEQVNPNQIAPLTIFRVKDDGTPVSLAGTVGDPQVYVASQVSASGVHFPVHSDAGETVEKVAAFAG